MLLCAYTRRSRKTQRSTRRSRPTRRAAARAAGRRHVCRRDVGSAARGGGRPARAASSSSASARARDDGVGQQPRRGLSVSIAASSAASCDSLARAARRRCRVFSRLGARRLIATPSPRSEILILLRRRIRCARRPLLGDGPESSCLAASLVVDPGRPMPRRPFHLACTDSVVLTRGRLGRGISATLPANLALDEESARLGPASAMSAVQLYIRNLSERR